ncbi:MAG: NifB/NifX family molybdenum-iron cluster-binding protein [Thermoplasmata archaeon]|nr:NifB/NifX family molybdenum-iron cluster-binding protein [Thermoplasmata archaeon]
MKIAIPSEDEKGLESEISMHFGRCRYYTFIEIEDGELKNVEVVKVSFEEHGYGELPEFIKKHGANLVIAYGMGERAIDYFNNLGIDVITGVKGKIKEVVEKFVEGKLFIDANWKNSGEFGKHEH